MMKFCVYSVLITNSSFFFLELWEIYIIINFKTYKINLDIYKLIPTPTIIQKKIIYIYMQQELITSCGITRTDNLVRDHIAFIRLVH